MKRNFSQYLSDNVNCFNVSGGSNNSISFTTVRDERSELLKWICPLESWKRHQDVSATRVKGVGDWVLGSRELQAWLEEQRDGSVDRTLFCGGIPGAGKTFVCSLVIDTLCDNTALSNVGIACLYCDYRGQEEQVTVNMIGSLLRQFVAGQPEIPEELIQAFQAAKSHLGGRALSLDKILEIFPQVLASFDKTFICIDALDEFLVEHRAEFLRCLKQVIEESPNTRLFLTGRPYIQAELDKHLTKSASIITVQPSQDDVTRFLIKKLENDPEPEAMDDCLRSEIMERIAKEHSEIFLLATLHIDAVLGEVTIGDRREKLHEIKNGLDDAYNANLERIQRQRRAKARLGIATLMWISLVERPLHIDELCHALAVNVGSKDIDTGKIPSPETILGSCLGLVTVDQGTSTVRLIHATLQEYLRTRPDLFQNPHSTIAEVCLSYLNFQSV
ncbi:hypothetical protein L873DRAFT_1696147, partial [Choiromyces venosus 120613-1]